MNFFINIRKGFPSSYLFGFKDFIFNRGVFPSLVYLYIFGYVYMYTYAQSLEEGFGSLEAGVPVVVNLQV